MTRRLSFPQQLRQLRDIGRNPPRLVGVYVVSISTASVRAMPQSRHSKI
jgi:hypothetical protein